MCVCVCVGIFVITGFVVFVMFSIEDTGQISSDQPNMPSGCYKEK